MTSSTPRAVDRAPDWTAPLLRALDGEIRGAKLAEVRVNDLHSNDVFQLRFDDGRILMVKLGRHEWSGTMFERARAASRLIREGSDLIAPAPLDVDSTPDGRPLQAYWRIALPTLGELWPGLTEAERVQAMISCGAMTRRLHGVRIPFWGPLWPRDAAAATLAGSLESDLAGRLAPAVAALWPEALGPLQGLIAAVPAVARRVHGAQARLVHNDLHMGNVLCETDCDGVHCVGLLDLDATLAAPPEVDIASFEMLHGPLFEQRIEPRWMERFREGYGGDVDERLVAFFRAVHLANMGFHSALVGHDVHAAMVAEALRSAVAGATDPRLGPRDALNVSGKTVPA